MTAAPGPVVTVWTWSLDAADLSAEAAAALLSEDEKARSARLVSDLHRRRFAAGRARLRLLLGQHLGLEPAALSFSLNPYGKPSLVQAPSFHFSLSHSEDEAMLAVSDTLVVGADVERVRAVDHLDLAYRYFHADEAAAIAAHARPEDQRRAFFRIWTLKEAVVKALGLGLSIPLDGFVLSIAGERPAMVRPPEGTSSWWLELSAGDYCRALAVPAGGEVGLIQRRV